MRCDRIPSCKTQMLGRDWIIHSSTQTVINQVTYLGGGKAIHLFYLHTNNIAYFAFFLLPQIKYII